MRPLHVKRKRLVRDLFVASSIQSDGKDGAHPIDHDVVHFPEKNQSDDEDSELSSVMSFPEDRNFYDDYSDDDDDEDSEIELSLKEKWDELERIFKERDRLLARIIKGKSEEFVQQMLRRERIVRRKEREQLLLSQLYEGKAHEDFIPDSPGKGDERAAGPSFYQRCRNALVFEMNSTIPAVFSIMVHCIAHNGIYDGLNAIFDMIKREVTRTSESPRIELTFFIVTLFLGVLMLRLTGDLFWWLNDRDYDCLKFDYHNRLRLEYRDAKIMSWVRTRDLLRVTLYMVGYHFCYASASVIHFYVSYLFDQKEALLSELPSVKYGEEGVCLTERDESFCSHTCQEEVDRQEEEYLTMKQADMNYTWEAFSLSSYETYWHDWVHRSDYLGASNEPLFSTAGYFSFCFGSTIVALCLLRLYGFVFWAKY